MSLVSTGLEHDDPVRIGRYSILRRIGAGGMAVVYRAFDPELDRQVALKLLDPERFGPDDRVATRLLREARAIARVTHPNVFAVYDVEGQPLSTWANEIARPWTEIVRMFIQAGRGLVAAHEAGLVHRDFKPHNVLVGDDGRARVLDFGLARPAPLGTDDDFLPADTQVDLPSVGEIIEDDDSVNVTTTGIITGTPAYMAPEQHLGRAATEASDQFAYCVALWEALYQRRPFEGRTAFAIADAIIENRLSPVPKRTRVPGWLHALLVKGLSVDPADRHSSMRSLLASIVFTSRFMP